MKWKMKGKFARYAIAVTSLASLLVLTESLTAVDDEGSGGATKGHVFYCSDGDTCRIKVADGTVWMNVRLFGIDAPETAKKRKNKQGQPMGDAAREFLNATVKDKDVTLTQADLDPYNRPVVEIFLDGKSVNLMMIEKGFAEMYRGKTKRIDRKKFAEAENKAKSDRVGIWGQNSYVSPATFRKENK